MSFNLVDLIKDQVSDQVLGQISNAVGENSDTTKSVIEGAIPALLGGFMDKASSGEGAGALFDAVSNQDDSILDNLSGMISSDNKTALIESGGSALGSVFGSTGASGLVSAISGSSGMSLGGTSTVLSMATPMVMSTLKRFMSGGGSNDAGGLASVLADQKDNIAGAMPSGLADQLGASGFMSNIGNLLGSGAGAAAGVAGLAGAVDGVTGSISEAAGDLGDMASGAVDGVTGSISEAAGGLGDMASGAVDGVTSSISGVAGGLGDMASGAVDGVTGSISEAAGDVASSASNIAGSATGAMSGVAGSMSNTVGDAASTGGSWIKKLIIPLVLAVLAFFGWKQFGGSSPDVSGAVGSATSAVSGMVGGDMTTNITGMFGSATESLSKITDVESAKAAIPALTDFSSKLDGVASMADKLPDAAKPVLASALGKVLPMLDSVMAISGVGAVLGSVIEPLKEKLNGLAG